MARFATVLIPTSDAPIDLTGSNQLAASTATTQLIGKNRIFVISSDQDIMITFGTAAEIAGSTFPAASATYGYRIPANQQTTLDMGQALDTIGLFNLNSSTAAIITIQLLSVV